MIKQYMARVANTNILQCVSLPALLCVNGLLLVAIQIQHSLGQLPKYLRSGIRRDDTNLSRMVHRYLHPNPV